jgi:hypothetical protein
VAQARRRHRSLAKQRQLPGMRRFSPVVMKPSGTITS